MFAYHFVGETLRDGRPVPADGEWLEHDGPVVPGLRGLHASFRPFDALMRAPHKSNILCLVELGGEIVNCAAFGVAASRRKIVNRIDARSLLTEFACRCATSVIDLWATPDYIREYLESNGKSGPAWTVNNDIEVCLAVNGPSSVLVKDRYARGRNYAAASALFAWKCGTHSDAPHAALAAMDAAIARVAVSDAVEDSRESQGEWHTARRKLMQGYSDMFSEMVNLAFNPG